MLRSAVFALAIGLIWVAPAAAAPLSCPNVVRVSVLADGKLLVDGNAATLDELETRMTAVAAAHGSVWYHREGDQNDPVGQAQVTSKAVIDKVIAHRLPISFSSKSDFSDSVGEDDISTPRTRC